MRVFTKIHLSACKYTNLFSLFSFIDLKTVLSALLCCLLLWISHRCSIFSCLLRGVSLGLSFFWGEDAFLVSLFFFSVELSFLEPCLILSEMPDLSSKMSDFFSKMSEIFSEMSDFFSRMSDFFSDMFDHFSEPQHTSRRFSVLALNPLSSVFFCCDYCRVAVHLLFVVKREIVLCSPSRAYACAHSDRCFMFFTVTSVTIVDNEPIYKALHLSPSIKRLYYAVTDMV